MASGGSVKNDQTTPLGLKSLAQANNFLAINLYRILAEEKGNVFFSPFSISIAMSMLLCAAEDTTESELMKALGYDEAGIYKNDLPSIFKQKLNALLKNPESYTLTCANSMLSQKGFEVKSKFKSILSESFNALLLEVDFQKDSQKVVNQINEWVKTQTKNMITQLVDNLDPDTVMVLVNAVYFKGSWLQQFDKNQTFFQKFFNKGLAENSKMVNMMHMKESFSFYENESFKALQLPYVGEEIAMLILLPRERNGLESLESSLTPLFIHELENKMVKKKVDVSLPRFRLEYSKSLVPCFKKLGVEKAFRVGAEFGIASDSKKLAVSDIIHKAVLDVNEEGSEAAAGTMVGIMLMCLTYDPEFVVDHPFIFAIHDLKSDFIIFMGKVDEL